MPQFRLRAPLVVLATGLACLMAWILLALAISAFVNAIHLAILYGVEPVVSGQIYFTSTRPELIVSNGDHLTSVQKFLRAGAVAILWLPSCLAVALALGTFAARRLRL